MLISSDMVPIFYVDLRQYLIARCESMITNEVTGSHVTWDLGLETIKVHMN